MSRHGGRVRIIAGRWRRRLIPVPDVPGLRPTGDRVRETLFSWLGDAVPGSRCLDLFAGCGALGFEALSRGADRVTLVERSRVAVAALREQARVLGAGPEVEVVHADALAWLLGPAAPFDLVFLDPPFGEGMLEAACGRLEARGWLAPRALIYLEASRREAQTALPQGWRVVHDNQAGQVSFRLARREAWGSSQ